MQLQFQIANAVSEFLPARWYAVDRGPRPRRPIHYSCVRATACHCFLLVTHH